MTKIAVWCRHAEDNIIGIGAQIPWKILSDFKRFRRITEGQSIVAGEKTYETFPNRTLPNRKIYVLTFNLNYQVSDAKNHFVVTDINEFQNFDGNLFISGGASVYKAFMTGNESLMPEIIVDSMFNGDLNRNLKGEHVDVTPCINIMNSYYDKVSKDYELDNVITTVWVKKGSSPDKKILQHIITAIEADGEK